MLVFGILLQGNRKLNIMADLLVMKMSPELDMTTNV